MFVTLMAFILRITKEQFILEKMEPLTTQEKLSILGSVIIISAGKIFGVKLG